MDQESSQWYKEVHTHERKKQCRRAQERHTRERTWDPWVSGTLDEPDKQDFTTVVSSAAQDEDTNKSIWRAGPLQLGEGIRNLGIE